MEADPTVDNIILQLFKNGEAVQDITFAVGAVVPTEDLSIAYAEGDTWGAMRVHNVLMQRGYGSEGLRHG